MSQQTPKRARTTGPSGDDQAGPSSGNVSQNTPDPRALARSEQVSVAVCELAASPSPPPPPGELIKC